ncbi:transketolase C-terminal domain-containing protein [Pseudomonas sp. F1_0610]|uniref:transketolase C-terminal domain-containing protein n=1 Tax=Pseudomonas sp. F1_0610 TaxID=3114284 RepID=UPI0039C1E616
MAQMSLLQAINNALDIAMHSDDKVLCFGEDVGSFGGVFRASQNLQEKYGKHRCFNTPLTEQGILGFANGLAAQGHRPVAEIQFADYIFPAFDQIVNETAKYRYRSGNEFNVGALTIRTPYGGGISGGLYHSQSPEAFFAHAAGLKIVVPRDPYQAKGLLLASIRDADPVLFFEPKKLYRAAVCEVPEDDYQIELGKAEIVREGTDISLVAWGAQVATIVEAADKAQAQGISCEVIDLRSLIPWDRDLLAQSLKKTGRMVINHEAARTGGFGAELAASLQEVCFLYLEAPITRVTGWDTPFPYALDAEYMPDVWRTLEAIHACMNY